MRLSSPNKQVPLILRLLLGVLLTTLSVTGGLFLFIVVWVRIMHQPRFRDRLVQWNKHTLNPIMLKYAGHHASIYASLKHVGRRSGQIYTTPVVARPLEDGFVIPLPYGAGADWCRNVLAAGTCELLLDEQEYLLERPELLTMKTVAKAFPLFTRCLYVAGDIKQYLWLHPHKEGAEPVSTPEETPLPAPAPSSL